MLFLTDLPSRLGRRLSMTMLRGKSTKCKFTAEKKAELSDSQERNVSPFVVFGSGMDIVCVGLGAVGLTH